MNTASSCASTSAARLTACSINGSVPLSTSNTMRLGVADIATASIVFAFDGVLLVFDGLFFPLQALAPLIETGLDLAVERVFGVLTVAVGLAGGNAAEQFHQFLHTGYRIDVELTRLTGSHHILAQHQVLRIGLRDHHTLACQPRLLTHVEEPLDLVVDAADGLDGTVLVDGAGHRQRLPERHLADGRQQNTVFDGRRTVAIHRTVGLLEHQAGTERDRQLPGKAAAQQRGDDEHALAVNRATQRRLAFHVEHAAPAGTGGGTDPARPPEPFVADAEYRQAVGLAHRFAVGVDEDDVAPDLLQHLFAHLPVTVASTRHRFVDVRPVDAFRPRLPCPVIGLAQHVGH